MEQVILISIGITILYILAKWIESKYIEKITTDIPMKKIVRDAIILFIVSFTSLYAYFNINTREFYSVLTNGVMDVPIAQQPPQIFTDSPNF